MVVCFGGDRTLPYRARVDYMYITIVKASVNNFFNINAELNELSLDDVNYTQSSPLQAKISYFVAGRPPIRMGRLRISSSYLDLCSCILLRVETIEIDALEIDKNLIQFLPKEESKCEISYFLKLDMSMQFFTMNGNNIDFFHALVTDSILIKLDVIAFLLSNNTFKNSHTNHSLIEMSSGSSGIITGNYFYNNSAVKFGADIRLNGYRQHVSIHFYYVYGLCTTKM
jgi:hypothetical protein